MKESKVATPAPPVHVKAPETVRRNCPCGRKTPGGEECAECEKKKETLRRSALGAGPATAPPVVGEALRSPGRSLPASTRAVLEPGFGRDFSGVRVHTGPTAAESARAVQARAYTVGQDIVFGAGQYEPDSYAGLHLLAHELAHTAQDGGGMHRAARDGSLVVGAVSDPAEHEAEAAADAVVAGRAASIAPAAAPARVRRAPAGGDTKAKKPFTGTEVHSAIVNQFRQRFKSQAFSKAIPGASFSAKRGEFSDIEDRSKGLTGGKGIPDLALVDNRALKVAEIKPGLAEKKEDEADQRLQVQFGREQAQNYVSAATADNNAEWRRKLGIDDATLMEKGLFTPEGITTPGGAEVRTAWPEDGVLLYAVPDPRSPAGAAAFQPLEISYDQGGRTYSATIFLTKGAPKTFLRDSNLRDNRDAANAIPGLVLDSAEHKDPKKVAVIAFIRTLRPGTDGTAIGTISTAPFAFAVTDGKLVVTKRKVKARVSRFSEADLEVTQGPQGVVAEGPLKTEIPLLKNAPLRLSISGERAAVELKAGKKAISTPVPGLRITEAGLSVTVFPDLKGEGTLDVAVGPADKPYAQGRLTVSADANGLVTSGDVVGHIPGIDEAKGNVTYQNRQLSGSLNLSASQFKVPIPGVSVTRVALKGTFDDNGLAVGGQVDATLPGNTKVTLGAAGKLGGPIVYTGKVHVEVPKLKGVDVDVTYDGDHFEGSAKTAVEYGGLVGNVTVHYRDGAVFGDGTVTINKGKLNGTMKLKLSKEHRLSGEGSVDYPLSEKIVGKIGVKLDESGKFTVLGGLRVVQPIQVFEGFHNDFDKELFHQLFPIPGLSLPVIGGVGVDVSVHAGFEYGVGPGTLHDVFIETQFDPFEPNMNLVLQGGAQFDIPAHAAVYLRFSGGIGVGNNFVSASGGLSILGRVGVDGGFRAKVDLAYAQKRFVIEAEALIQAGLTLSVELGVYVEGHALSWSGRKDWKLAGFQWGTGSQIEVSFPVRYASDEPFKVPSRDSIKVKLPQIDVPGAVKQLLGQTNPTDSPGK
jgi:hypothetical protein